MRIVVALSGGVDSATTAALLTEAGHEVIAITLQLYESGVRRHPGACCAGEDIHDARRVADELGIPHYVIDAEKRFRKAVIEDFAASYARGETPVPCVRCNQSVKFPDLLKLAHELDAEALATGHYVRRIDGPDGPELHRALDLARDQTWFLFALKREQLAFCRFPLGDLPNKARVRAEAERLGLRVAQKPDSQDLCFVAGDDYAEVVGKMRPDALEGGEIVDRTGHVLGRHGGIARYTVGQGKHLGTAAQVEGERQAVVAIDAARHRVVVGARKRGGVSRIRLAELNWLIAPPREPFTVAVKLRSREEPQGATVFPSISDPSASAEVELDHPAFAAPGQACVFYDGSRVLGGGFIQAAIDTSASMREREAAGGVAQR